MLMGFAGSVGITLRRAPVGGFVAGFTACATYLVVDVANGMPPLGSPVVFLGSETVGWYFGGVGSETAQGGLPVQCLCHSALCDKLIFMDSKTNTNTIKIPKTFFDDHSNRELAGSAVITKELSKHYIITIDDPDLAELIDDCELYITPGLFAWDMQYLVSSARATLNAIRKQTTN